MDLLIWINKVLNLSHGELSAWKYEAIRFLYEYRHGILVMIGDTSDPSPDTNESRARRDLVPEGVSYLSSSKGQFSLVKLQQTLEVEEDSLSCFRPQIAANLDEITQFMLVHIVKTSEHSQQC